MYMDNVYNVAAVHAGVHIPIVHTLAMWLCSMRYMYMTATVEPAALRARDAMRV